METQPLKYFYSGCSGRENQLCSTFKARGYCNSTFFQKWMKSNCARTCGFCATPAPTSTAGLSTKILYFVWIISINIIFTAQTQNYSKIKYRISCFLITNYQLIHKTKISCFVTATPEVFASLVSQSLLFACAKISIAIINITIKRQPNFLLDKQCIDATFACIRKKRKKF